MSLEPNPRIAAMAAYALPELEVPPGVRLRSLAQNESALSPSPAALEAASRALIRAALYPDPDWGALRCATAEVHGVDPERILCGSGSMELIATLAVAYLAAGDRALTSQYGYLFFRTAARLAGAEVDLVPESELSVDVPAMLQAVTPSTRMVFVANPGNPTGTHIAREALLTLRAGLPDDVLLIIDEAYGEFAERPGESVFDLVARGDTVVLRTFSKAYGLAGLRVGWGVFPSDVAQQVRKIQLPGSVGVASQAAATAAMQDQAFMRQSVTTIAERRDRFAARARALGLQVPVSRTNFVLLGFADVFMARSADAALRAQGVLMRGMDGYGLSHCLRATVGSEEDMDLAAELLAAVMKEGGAS